MILKNIISSKTIITIVVVLSLFSSYPYVFNRIFSLPDVQTLGPILLVFSFICYLLFKRTVILGIPRFLIIIGLLQSLVWVIYSVCFNDTTYLTRVFFLIWSLMIIMLLNSTRNFRNFIKFNNCILAVQAFGGLFAFILVFMGKLSPLLYYTLENGQDGYCYILTCTNVALDNVIRAAGYFDEPGALAFWGIYTLLLNKLFVNNKYIEYIIVIGLLSTLSAAYFIQVSLYMAFFRTNSFKKVLPVIIFLIVIIIVLQNFSDNNYVAKYTVDRFQGGHINSTRYYLADLAKSYFFSSPLFGIGASKMQSITYMGDNPYEILASDGFFGYLITYMPLFYVLLRFKNKELLFACLILMAGYMQRPFHPNLLHYFYLYSFCLICYIKYGKKTINLS